MTTPHFASGALAAALCAFAITACTHVEPRFGVCRQQVTDYVEQQLGQTLRHIEVQSYAQRMPPRTLFDTGSALVYVNECDGFHGFEILATEDLCEHIPHYGSSSGSFIRYEGAFGPRCRAA